MRRLRLLLDANVLVDAQVRDFLLGMAEAELLDVRWSDEILDDLHRALVGTLGRDRAKVDRLVGTLKAAFPHAGVDTSAVGIGDLVLPDPGDRHVLAAAVVGECDWLVTDNVRDFPDAALEPLDVVRVDVSQALLLLSAWFHAQVPAVLGRVLDRLRSPAMDVDGWLRRLEARHPLGAIGIGKAMGIDEYARYFDQMRVVDDTASPQSAIEALLGALQQGDDHRVHDVVGPDLVIALRRSAPADGPVSLLDLLRTRLADVWALDGWGWAGAWRVQGIDQEVVKLVRAGDEVQIAREPRSVHGHVFVLERQDGWVVVGLDGVGAPIDPAWAASTPGADPDP